jgi:hypothetical protein
MPRLIEGSKCAPGMYVPLLSATRHNNGTYVCSQHDRDDCCYRLQPCADRQREISGAEAMDDDPNFESHLAYRKDPRSPVGWSKGSPPNPHAPEAITYTPIRSARLVLSLSTGCKSYLGSLLEDVMAVVQHCPRAKRQTRVRLRSSGTAASRFPVRFV